MSSLLNEIVIAAVPVLITAFGTILTVILSRAAEVARARWGIEVEATHREALHAALMSGVRAALLKGIGGYDAIEEAIVHASGSVPDAIKALQPSSATLTRIAEGKLREAMAEMPPSLAGVVSGLAEEIR